MQGIAWQGEPPIWVHEFLTENILPDVLGRLMARAGFGLILTDVDRRIFFINDKAETFLQSGQGLSYERNRISSSGHFAASRKLEELIFEASHQSNHFEGAGSLLIRDEKGAASLAVHVMPLSLCQLAHQPMDEYPSVALILVDCRPAPAERMQLFANLFALTAGEARVAAEIIQGGGGLKKVAVRMNKSPATVRTHLTSIMEKTGTHRQAELVKLFYQVTLPGSWDLCDTGRLPQRERTTMAGHPRAFASRRNRPAMEPVTGRG